MSHFTTLVIGEDHDYQLAPFHEYECTGIDDEFVVDVDIPEEAQDVYEIDTTTLVIQRPDGSRFSAFEGGRYVDELRPFIVPFSALRLPQGYEEIRGLLAKDWQTFEEWATQYYGAEIVEGRVLRHTNPKAKWDWYQTGGRWDGLLKLKDGTTANSARKGDVDWQGFSVFALVKNRHWAEQGKMGWWGIVTEPVDKDNWNDWVMKTIKDLPDDEIVTVVDCHI